MRGEDLFGVVHEARHVLRRGFPAVLAQVLHFRQDDAHGIHIWEEKLGGRFFRCEHGVDGNLLRGAIGDVESEGLRRFSEKLCVGGVAFEIQAVVVDEEGASYRHTGVGAERCVVGTVDDDALDVEGRCLLAIQFIIIDDLRRQRRGIQRHIVARVIVAQAIDLGAAVVARKLCGDLVA